MISISDEAGRAALAGNTKPVLREIANALGAELRTEKKARRQNTSRHGVNARPDLGERLPRKKLWKLCFARSGGRCENPFCQGGGLGKHNRLTLDHFIGRANAETVETCWLICQACHDLRTDENPTAIWWLNAFLQHIARFITQSAAYAAVAAEAEGLRAWKLNKRLAGQSLTRDPLGHQNPVSEEER